MPVVYKLVNRNHIIIQVVSREEGKFTDPLIVMLSGYKKVDWNN